jgi:hypothetical protein
MGYSLMPDLYTEVTSIVKVDSDIGQTCECCDFWIGPEPGGCDRFKESVEHYMREHNYRLLHIGQETRYDSQYGAWQCTVAVLGK